jgi:hypothetical protein
MDRADFVLCKRVATEKGPRGVKTAGPCGCARFLATIVIVVVVVPPLPVIIAVPTIQPVEIAILPSAMCFGIPLPVATAFIVVPLMVVFVLAIVDSMTIMVVTVVVVISILSLQDRRRQRDHQHRRTQVQKKCFLHWASFRKRFIATSDFNPQLSFE